MPTSQDSVNELDVVAYLLSTKPEGIVLGPSAQEPVDIFTDAGAEKLEDKATSGILTRIGMYIALSMGVQDGLWLKEVVQLVPRGGQDTEDLDGQQGNIYLQREPRLPSMNQAYSDEAPLH